MPMDRPEPKSAPSPQASSGSKTSSSGPPQTASVAGHGVATSTQRPWLVRKRGANEVLSCPDLSTLRQWIVDRRIARDDEISRSGQRWRRMGSVVELESLFYSAEQERAQKRRTTGALTPVPVQAQTAGATSAPRLTPVPAPVATTPGSGVPTARPTPVPVQAAPAAASKAPESGPVKTAAAAKPAEPAVTAKIEATPAPAAAAPPPADKKPAEPSAVGPVKVTPPSGLAAASGGLSPMRLARKDPNRGKPQAMPGMAGSVQAAMRAAGTPPTKPAATASSEAKKPEAAAPANRTAAPAQPPTKTPVAPPAKPAASSSARSAADKSDASTSGAQTVVFSRKDKDRAHEDDDADRTRKLPPADSRATERQPARTRDPVEDAILRNDPVPRHLKEAAESGDALRRPVPDTHATEYVDAQSGTSPRRRTVFLLLAVVALGGGIWYFAQGSDNPNKPTSPTTQGMAATPTPQEPGTTGQAAGANPATATPGPTNPPPVVEPLPSAANLQAAPPAPTPPVPAVTAEPLKPEATKPEAKPAATKPEPTKPEPTKPEPAKSTTPAPPAATATPAEGTPAKPTISLAELRQKIGEDIPKGFDDQMELAQRLVEHYKYDSAQALYEYLLSYASAVPAIHNGLGTCAFEKNRADEAIQHYRDALERRPNYSAAIFGLAKTYHRLKNDKEQALVYYKKYLELNPKGSAAAISREAIAKLEGQPPPAAVDPRPAAP
jgi:hypothetical protein